MKIATWNVNSLKVRLPHVKSWLAFNPVDVLCLQEIKLQDADFPHDELLSIGYHSVCSGQKTYNGVAILSRKPVTDVQFGIPDFVDEQKRVISATVDNVRIICVYVPNGQEVGCDKYSYKLRWLAALRNWLRSELSIHPQLVILGDFNIAPDDRDIYDPALWKDKILASPDERAAFRELLELPLRDAFRLFDQPEKSFSWWDYRMMAFRRNMGLRIDLILASNSVRCSACEIDKAPRKLERPSDHAPVIAEIETQ